MGALAGINRIIGLFAGCFSSLFNGKIWVWLGGYFLLQLLVLYAFFDFTNPVFFGSVTWWTSLFGDQASTGFSHYPGQFRLMPYFFGWTKFYLGVLAEGTILGMVAYHFSRDIYGEEEIEADEKRSWFYRWINLSMGWLAINGIIILIATFLPDLLGPLIEGHPRRTLLFEFAILPGLYVLVLSHFMLVIPLQVVYRLGFLSAVKESFQLLIHYPIQTISMSTVILSGPIIASFITTRPSWIVDRFRPELVFWFLLGGLIIETAANFLWMGSTVRLIAEEDF